jgi:predicted DNA-binding protein
VAEELVMRSVYVPASEDARLRQLAHESGYTKSDLIRAAIKLKVEEWVKSNGLEQLRNDVAAGLREASLQREVKKVKPASVRPQAEAKPSASRGSSKTSSKATSQKAAAKKPAPKKVATAG